MELSDEEKINLLNVWINNLAFHINAMQKGINDGLDYDVGGKKSRPDALNDLINKKTFYENVLSGLQ